MNIFVAKLNYDTDEETLLELFEAYGEVESAKIIFDKFTGKSRGFGFVEMPNEDEAFSAIEALNDSEIDGRQVVVKKAEPRERNNRGGGGGYNRGGGGGYNRGGGGGYNRGGGGGYNRGGGGGYNRGGGGGYNRGGGGGYNRGGGGGYNRNNDNDDYGSGY